MLRTIIEKESKRAAKARLTECNLFVLETPAPPTVPSLPSSLPDSSLELVVLLLFLRE